MIHKHHIIPRHRGGSNEPSNLIELTVEEHAEAHKQLWLMDRDWQDELAYLTLSGQITKAEAIREASRQANLGRCKSEEQKAKIRAYRHTSETRLNMSKNHVGMKDKRHTDESKNKMRAAFAGRQWKKDPVTGKRVWI